MYIYSMKGEKLCKVPIDIGTVGAISCKRKHAEIFFSFTSFLSPGQIFKLDISDPKNAKTELYRETVVPGFKSADFVTEQAFYTSKDGTKVPMFIVAKKGFEKNGKNPCLLYGYGGFDISITPSFRYIQNLKSSCEQVSSSIRLPWMNNFNGLYCIANIRGGGEYGEEWHSAAIKSKKQTSYDDFQAAAEYLSEQQYSSSEHICIMGGSNGGLLVGACLNQRPELFSAGVAAVGVMDLLRFHRYTIGHAWCSDFGCSDQKSDFEYLKKLSPTHNIPNTEQFPAVLVTTADHDDRVVPHHSLKYLATLQEICTDTNRVLIGSNVN